MLGGRPGRGARSPGARAGAGRKQEGALARVRTGSVPPSERVRGQEDLDIVVGKNQALRDAGRGDIGNGAETPIPVYRNLRTRTDWCSWSSTH